MSAPSTLPIALARRPETIRAARKAEHDLTSAMTGAERLAMFERRVADQRERGARHPAKVAMIEATGPELAALRNRARDGEALS